MTDAEIKKALECHASKDLATCEECPLLNIQDCAYKLSENALDLINRQQAKIEAFEAKTVIQKGLVDRQRAEIERLQKELALKGLEYTLLERDRAKDICDFAEELKTIKAEAIKEFAERLKEKLDCDVHTPEGFYFMVSDTINNLVKEMVGEG